MNLKNINSHLTSVVTAGFENLEDQYGTLVTARHSCGNHFIIKSKVVVSSTVCKMLMKFTYSFLSEQWDSGIRLSN
jgi:hypothetical protein